MLAQIVMGGFDTVYHHELTERLAWRVSQQHELALHAARNLLYALVFILLGWFDTRGAWALALLTLLTIELVITLVDFVEEDLSREAAGKRAHQSHAAHAELWRHPLPAGAEPAAMGA